MKTKTLIFFLFSIISFGQNLEINTWKSKVSDLQVAFNSQWKIMPLFLDTDDKILIGLKDESDHSSIVIKITLDYSKEQLSDEQYFDAVKKQMLKANAENKLLFEDEIEFKKLKFKRLIFSMKTKFGRLIQTIYIHRNGKKMTGIQFAYPEKLKEKSIDKIPTKIEKVLSDLIL